MTAQYHFWDSLRARLGSSSANRIPMYCVRPDNECRLGARNGVKGWNCVILSSGHCWRDCLSWDSIGNPIDWQGGSGLVWKHISRDCVSEIRLLYTQVGLLTELDPTVIIYFGNFKVSFVVIFFVYRFTRVWRWLGSNSRVVALLEYEVGWLYCSWSRSKKRLKCPQSNEKLLPGHNLPFKLWTQPHWHIVVGDNQWQF